MLLLRLAVLLSGLVLFPALAQAAEPPRVVASLRPLHSLAAMVMEGVAEPALLVPSGSPHTYALKPSEARLLNGADVVVWVGPQLESFLEKPLASLGQRARLVTMASLPGLTRLPLREGGMWEQHDHHGHDHHDADSFDAHLWLDPANARVLVTALAESLASQDPERAARYRDNAARALHGLDQLDAELAALLAPVQKRPFLVFHDAYQYLERRYGLSAAGAIALDPERQPGARRVGQIRDRVKAMACVFREPQFSPKLVATVTEGSGARVGVLDPLGADIAPGPGQYGAMMRALARSLRDCLG